MAVWLQVAGSIRHQEAPSPGHRIFLRDHAHDRARDHAHHLRPVSKAEPKYVPGLVLDRASAGLVLQMEFPRQTVYPTSAQAKARKHLVRLRTGFRYPCHYLFPCHVHDHQDHAQDLCHVSKTQREELTGLAQTEAQGKGELGDEASSSVPTRHLNCLILLQNRLPQPRTSYLRDLRLRLALSLPS